MNTQPFCQTGPMIELCCEYLSVWCIWLHVIIRPCIHFRVNPHSVVASMSRNSLLEAGVHDLIRTYSQMHVTDEYSQLSSIIWPVWLNDWAFLYELSGCGFQSSCSHSNFRFCSCFEQEVPWHSGNYRMWIHSEMHTWPNKNIQSNALYR